LFICQGNSVIETFFAIGEGMYKSRTSVCGISHTDFISRYLECFQVLFGTQIATNIIVRRRFFYML
jgi:hypothetical protein